MAWRFLPLLGANDLELSHQPKEQTMMTITRGPRGLGPSIFLAVLIALVADATANNPAELIIRNGLIVTAVGRTEGDLRIRNGTIAEIGLNLTAAAGARVIEAKGMLVLPGGIDPHVHLTPTRTATTLKGADDYTSGPLAALAGGKMTITNFINQAATTDPRPTSTKSANLVT